jgi:hypothetical protein
MTVDDFKGYCIDKIKQHPQHKDALQEYYNLAMTEIENGESEDHEFELAINDIEDLVNE